MLQSLKFLTYFCNSGIWETVPDINLGARLRASALLFFTSWHSPASYLHCRGLFLLSGSCWEPGILHWDINAQAQMLPEYSQKNALSFSQL